MIKTIHCTRNTRETHRLQPLNPLTSTYTSSRARRCLSEHITNEEEKALTKFHRNEFQWQTLRADGLQSYGGSSPAERGRSAAAVAVLVRRLGLDAEEDKK